MLNRILGILTVFALSFTPLTFAAGLPAPWQSQDIGGVGQAGSSSESNGTFTVIGGGGDIWNNSDEFHYLYQPLVGDGEIIVRITGQTNTDGWAKAGVMIRESLAANSTHAILALTPGNGIAYQYRNATGGGSGNTGGPGASAPVWLRMIRSANRFIAFTSNDGVVWSYLSQQTITMANSVYMGIAVTAHNNGTTSTATFDNVTATTYGALPAPWTQTDIGGVNYAGAAAYNGTTFTVLGGGSDIWNANDQFHFTYQGINGDGELIARVTTLTATDGWAKIGVMIRESTAVGAANAFMELTPSNGGVFHTRNSTNAGSNNNSSSAASVPYWVRLVRTGDTFTGYVSPDGTTWTSVGSQSITMGTTVYAGLAVTAHNNSTLNAVTFDNVSVTGTPAVLPPSIVTDPSNKLALVGQTATFTAAVAGTSPFTYQWQLNSADILGATNPSYTTPATVIGDNGSQYRVIVTNSAGSATSAQALLTVVAPGGGTGLQGDYYSNVNLLGRPTLSRLDSTVNFDWGGGPADPSLPADNFSVRWTGQVQAQVSETYTFYTVSDDGVRLWVNGQLIISNWGNHGPTEDIGTITLAAGQKYDIQMEHFDSGGGAVATLSWSSASIPKAIIPQSQLFPPVVPGLATDPILWWKMDDGAGAVAADSSGWGNPGSLANGPTWTTGQFGGALNFDGNNQGSSLSNLKGLPKGNAAHTVMAWIKINAYPSGRAWMMLLGNEGPGAHHWLLGSDGSTQLGVWNSGPGAGQVNLVLPLGTWFHLAITSDGSTLTGYINGVSIGTTPVTFNIEGSPLTLAQGHLGESFFNGIVDDFKIYNYGLSAAEVATQATPPSPAITVSDSGGSFINTASAAGQRAFGNQLVNTTSSARTITITNSGTAVLTLGAPTLSGGNSSEFSLSGLSPGNTLAIGASATFTVTFSPTSVGAKATTVSIPHDGSNTATPFTFDLSGTGIAPAIGVQRGVSPIASGSNDVISGTTVGNATTLNYTINNSGTAPLNLTSSPYVVISGASNCAASVTAQPTSPIAASGSSAFTASVTPAAVGAWNFTVTIANDSPGSISYTWTVSGTATAPSITVSDVNGAFPSAALATGVRAFGNKVVNTSSSITITITNSGSAPLTVSSLALSGPDASQFSLGSLSSPSPLAPTGSATFSVTFTPTTLGAKAATVTIGNNSLNASPFTFNLSGTGVAPAISVSDSNGAILPAASAGGVRAFANQLVGSSSATINITITNSGTSPLTVSSVSLSGTGTSSFALGALSSPSPLAPGATSIFTVQFSPVSAGAKSATVSIVHNGTNTGTPFTFGVSGTGLAPNIAVQRGVTPVAKGSTDSITGTLAGTATVLTYTVNNTGTSSLTLTGIPKVVISSPLNCTATVTAQPSSPLANGGSTTFTVSVTPTVAGAWSFTSSIASNDTFNTPYTWTVSGTANWPITPPPSPWADVDVGTVGVAGGTTVSGGVFTVKGSGVDIGGGTAPESFHFLYRPLTGNGSVTVRINSMSNTDPLAKAGIMFRSDLTVGGSYVFAGTTPTGTLGIRRTVTNTRLRVQPVTSTAVDGAYAPPSWLRIVRSGNTFSSYKSHDGVTWVLIETVNMTFLPTLYVGIAVTSKNNSALNTTVVSNITVGP